jgi:signal recognition particle receptor subunit beta
MASFTDFVERIMTPSPTVFIVGFLIILLGPILLHYIVVRTTPYTTPPKIILLGPSLAGKTSLLTRLERGTEAVATHTSQVPHSIELTTSSSPENAHVDKAADPNDNSAHTKFLLLDTPGHGKLRQGALANLSKQALGAGKIKAVVFVVDASTLTEHATLSAAAMFLYDTLLCLQRRATTSSTTPPPGIPVLVAANKLDLFTALPAALVKANLEAELGRIRTSRSKGLLDSGVGIDEVGNEERDDWLGRYGSEKFAFEQMREFDVDVDVIGGNVTGENGPGIEKWWRWMAEKI